MLAGCSALSASFIIHLPTSSFFSLYLWTLFPPSISLQDVSWLTASEAPEEYYFLWRPILPLLWSWFLLCLIYSNVSLVFSVPRCYISNCWTNKVQGSEELAKVWSSAEVSFEWVFLLGNLRKRLCLRVGSSFGQQTNFWPEQDCNCLEFSHLVLIVSSAVWKPWVTYRDLCCFEVHSFTPYWCQVWEESKSKVT